MLISVIIPTFERYFLLRDALESVLLQRRQLLKLGAEIEIIIVNDGSLKDGIPFDYDTYLAAYKCSSVDIKIVSLSSNMGVSSARNEGLALSNGDFVAFLDSDDIFLPNKLALQVEFMLENSFNISHTDEFWYRQDKGFVNKNKANLYDEASLFLDKCRVSPSSLVVTRGFLTRFLSKEPFFFDTRLKVCEDYDFILRANIFEEIGYLGKKLIIKRAVASNSLSAQIKHIESIRLDILSSFYERYSSLLDAPKRNAVLKELERKLSIVKK